MTNKTETEEDGDDVETMTWDWRSFTRKERLAVQTRFDTEFPDLVDYVYSKLASSDLDMTVAVVHREGTRFYADEILTAMLHQQMLRTDPDVKFEDLDFTYPDLMKTLARPKAKKALTAGKESKT